ncbi:MAG: dUTP diphosphatase [Ruminiclostridium sp.]|nr:dUTP diphosphatase [Ruminiclostridium sp.]
MNIKTKKLNENAKLPYRATEGSAGADLFACIGEDITIAPGERILIPTGIAIELPDSGCGAFVFPRSSVSSKYGVSLANCVGVIDSDYRGEIKVPLINHSDEPYTVRNGDRIAQMVILPVIVPEYTENEQLGDTERGGGGFGSTGK